MFKNKFRYIKSYFLLILLITIPFFLTGCWNYKEINDIWMVAGASIDWNEQEQKYTLTAEIAKTSSGKIATSLSKNITFSSSTIFDAMRRGITYSGRKLYWGHTSIIVLSDSFARKGIIPVIDLVHRGSEFRPNLAFIISKERTAKEILNKKMNLYDAASFELTDILENKNSVSTYVDSEFWTFKDELTGEGISPVLSTVNIVKQNNKDILHVSGAGVFKKDKLIGYIDDFEAKSLLIIKNQLKGGVIPLKNVANSDTNVSLEVLNCKTKLKPSIKGNTITMNVKVKLGVGIAEIEGTKDFISEPGFKSLKAAVDKTIKPELYKLIYKAQTEFDSDILGYGRAIQVNYPKQWKKLSKNWDQDFKAVKTNISIETKVITSYRSYKTISVGD